MMLNVKKVLALVLCFLLAISSFRFPVAFATEDPLAPIPTIEEHTPTPTVEEPTPAPAVEEPTPTPTVEEPTPAPIVEEPTPAPAVEEPTSTPIEEESTPAPSMEEPTPTGISDFASLIMPMADTSASDFLYTISNNKVTITGYTGSGTNVIIPGTIKGYPVTAIGEYAFDGNLSIQRITLPNSITIFHDYAFSSIENLSSINMPSELTTIGKCAFGSCSNLSNLTLPNKVKTIGESAFSFCNSLGSLSIPASVTSIGYAAFNHAGLTEFQVAPDNTAFTAFGGILYNEQMTELVAYPKDKAAASFSIPSGVEAVRPFAFKDAINLVNITLPSSLKRIGDIAFISCAKLKAITFPAGLEYIGEGSLSSCIALESVTIPPKVTTLPQFLFSGCRSLKSAYIPATVTNIGICAFQYCHASLMIYGSEGSAADIHAKANGISFTALDIPTSTPAPVAGVNIETDAVSLCVGVTHALTAVVLPADANQCLVWTSDNEEIATVNAAGMVTAKKVGTATITATAQDGSGAFDSCEVTVLQYITKIEINKEAVIYLGETLQLTLDIIPADASNTALTWTTSDRSIATVDANGKVTAIAYGTATIKATAKDGSGKSASCTITVKRALSGLHLNKNSATLSVGDKVSLAVTAVPADATIVNLTWSSSNSSIATINQSGAVTAIKPGTATITAAANSGSIKKTCTVTVIPKVTAITLNHKSLTIAVGQSVNSLTANISPSNANQTVFWSSGKTAIATVTSNGTIRGVNIGRTYIQARTVNGLTQKCTITVVKAGAGVTGITISKTSASVEEGNTLSLSAKITPSSAQNKTVTWASSDKGIASVDRKGKVTAVKPGKVMITANASNGQQAKCTLTVKYLAVSKVTVSKTSLSVNEGEPASLKATVSPSNARYKTVTWSSSDPSIAKVDSKGKITTYKPGKVSIIATAHNGVKGICALTVKSLAVTKVGIAKSAITVKQGRSTTVRASISPSNARYKTLMWKSSDPKIATVTSRGVVKGIKPGTVTITVTAHNGVKAAFSVIVN